MGTFVHENPITAYKSKVIFHEATGKVISGVPLGCVTNCGYPSSVNIAISGVEQCCMSSNEKIDQVVFDIVNSSHVLPKTGGACYFRKLYNVTGQGMAVRTCDGTLIVHTITYIELLFDLTLLPSQGGYNLDVRARFPDSGGIPQGAPIQNWVAWAFDDCYSQTLTVDDSASTDCSGPYFGKNGQAEISP